MKGIRRRVYGVKSGESSMVVGLSWKSGWGVEDDEAVK